MNEALLVAAVFILLVPPVYIGLCALWGALVNAVQGDWESSLLCLCGAALVVGYFWLVLR